MAGNGTDVSEREMRRAEVAEMLTRRLPQTEMARRLGVTRTTIRNDIKAVTRAWLREIDNREKQMRASEANSLDHLEMVAQLNMENALAQRQKAVSPDGVVNSTMWERFDRAARGWFEKRIQIQERRAKLLNLDARPKQTAPTVQMPITFIAVAPGGDQDALPLNITPSPIQLEPGVVDDDDD